MTATSTTARRDAGTAAYPLTFGQEQLVLLEELAGAPGLVLPMRIALDGEVEPDRVAATLRRLVRRHDALRLLLDRTADGPVQVAVAHRAIEEIPADADAEAYGARDPWTLERATPLFYALDRSGPRPVLTLHLHHAFVDGWSAMLLRRSFHRLHHRPGDVTAAGAEDEPAGVGSFGEYARAQRAAMTPSRLSVHVETWERHLAGAEPLQLPGRRGLWAPGLAGGVFPRMIFDVEELSSDRLADAVAGRRASVSVLVLAALAAALRRATGQRDLLLSSVVADRGTARRRRLVGCLVNRVSVRVRLPTDRAPAAALPPASRALSRALRHQVGPFQRVGRQLDAGRILNVSPRVEVVCNHGLPDAGAALGSELPYEPVDGTRRSGGCHIWDSWADATDDLRLDVPQGRVGRPLRFSLTYRPEALEPDAVEELGLATARGLLALT